MLIFQKTSSWLHWFFWRVFCVSTSFSSAPILCISYLLIALEFVWSCPFSSFNFNDRVSILDLPLLLMWLFGAINFPLDTALNVSQRFWYIVSSFSLVSKNIFISVFISLFIQSSFRSRLFSFHIFVWFWVSFLIPSSNLVALLSERLVVMIFVLLHLLKSVLLPIMWSVLEEVWCCARKNVYSVDLGWKVL